MSDHSPLQFNTPIIKKQRSRRSQPVPVDPAVMALRQQYAKSFLAGQVAQCSKDFKAMSDEQRKALFYKLEHDGTIDLTGTNLSRVQEIGEGVTLAVPTPDAEDFEPLESKISIFVEGKPDKYGRPPKSSTVAPLNVMQKGIPFDRLSEPLQKKYKQLIKLKTPKIVCEIVITDLDPHSRPLKDGTKRKFIEDVLDELRISFQNGARGNMFEHEYAHRSYRAVIRCTGELFRELVEGESWQRKIFWFDDKPNFESLTTILSEFKVELENISSPDQDASIVCIVDSGLSPGNPFLKAVTKRETTDKQSLLKSFLSSKPDNPHDEYGHGSGVGSLAAYYVLNIDPDGKNLGQVWLAGARITKEDNYIDDGQLFSLTLEKVVEYFVPLGVKIFNLSVNDIDKCWNPATKKAVLRDSWVARKIDTLSRKHDIVFVISTGNLSMIDVNNFYHQGKEYPTFFTHPDTSLYDPAQAALALTVGAVAPPEFVAGRAEHFLTVAKTHCPAPFTRKGPGIAGEIKPELVEFGGNLVRNTGANSHVRQNPATDVVVASHQQTPAIARDIGTSLAAPRISHKLALLDSRLRKMRIEPSSTLLKSFLVTAAQWTEEMNRFVEEEVHRFHSQTSEKQDFSRMLFGYGIADFDRINRILTPDPYSATLYYQGEIETNKVAFFNVPVPESLAGRKGKKSEGVIRMTVTVSYLPEVQRWGLESYLGSSFQWKMYRGNVPQETIIDDISKRDDLFALIDDEAQTITKGEILGRFKVNCRSRGTIQHDVFEWTQHKREFSRRDHTLVIAANSNSQWKNRKQMPIPYAVVVHIEDESRSVPIFTKIRQSIQNKAKVKSKRG